MLLIAEIVSFICKGFHNLLSVLKMLNVQTVHRAMAGKCSTYYSQHSIMVSFLFLPLSFLVLYTGVLTV
jgi:hypothetical protein